MSAFFDFPTAADMAAARRTCQALEQAMAIGALDVLAPASNSESGRKLLAAAEVLGALEDAAVRQSAWDLHDRRGR